MASSYIFSFLFLDDVLELILLLLICGFLFFRPAAFYIFRVGVLFLLYAIFISKCVEENSVQIPNSPMWPVK